MPSPALRVEPDRCPGILRLQQAADGGLARVRLPGGLVSPGALRALAAAAAELGNPTLELTSRGNLQVRGLTDSTAADLEAVLAEVGLLPSRTHERVRNIVASPLAEFGPLVRALDDAICADARLAELSGRFLFGLDDSSGDIASLVPDVLVTLTEAPVDVPAVVASMLAEAHEFLDARETFTEGTAWRLEDLPYGRARLAARPSVEAPAAPAGITLTDDGRSHLAVLVPLGRLTTDQSIVLAELADGDDLRFTPWRSVVVPNVIDPDDALERASTVGLGVSTNSHWYGLSACAGRPGCAKSLADVQADAATAHHEPGVITHWSGCERRCGRPHNTQLDIVASATGYVRTEQRQA